MRRRYFILILVVLMALFLFGCGTPKNPAGNPSAPAPQNDRETLTVGIAADQGTLDPAVTMDNSAWKITYPCYQRLVEYDGASTNVKPGLATSWAPSADGLKWTFKLKSGNKFTDGTPVDANAVKFTFDRILKIAKGPADTFGVIKEVKVLDPGTVEFTLKHPFPPFVSTLAANYGGIVNPKVMDHQKDNDLGQNWLATHTMGSGIYQLSEWKQGQYYELTLNPAYSGEKPALKKVYFKIISDASAQRLQLEKGGLDIAEGIPVDQIKKLQTDASVTVSRSPSLLVDYVYINCSKGNPALKNVDVRQAISYAVDYQGIINSAMQGFATQMKGPIPKGLWGYDDQSFQYHRDVDKARQLLQQAKVSNLTLNLLYADNKPWWEQEAVTLQSNLSDIGIKVNLKKVAYATMREMMDKGDFDLCMGVWSPDYADPYMFMNYWFDSHNFGLPGNRAFYKNDRVDELVRQAGKTDNPQERLKLYQEAQKIVITEAPYIYLYQKDFLLPMSKKVKGFAYNPMLEGIYDLAHMSKD